VLLPFVFGFEGFGLFCEGGVGLSEVFGLLVEGVEGLVELSNALFSPGEFGFKLCISVFYHRGGEVVL
jgi:hypothetical protein